MDAKTDYPAACNSVEKILVHRAHERAGGIFQLQSALREAGVTVYGTEATTLLLGCPEAPSLRHEYGTPEVTVDLVDDMDEAIDKIHSLGSGHTEVRFRWAAKGGFAFAMRELLLQVCKSVHMCSTAEYWRWLLCNLWIDTQEWPCSQLFHGVEMRHMMRGVPVCCRRFAQRLRKGRRTSCAG